MTPVEHAELASLRERLEHLEALARHQAGIVVALYNGLTDLSGLMLSMDQIAATALTRPDKASELATAVKLETDKFDAAIQDIHARLGLMNEHLS